MGSGATARHGLSAREFEILREVVSLYLASGEPIASAMVARTSSTGLSSPSIRNIMAELADRGLLAQPHTSAGRVPSDEGLRVFVDHVLEKPALESREQRKLRAMLVAGGPLEEVLDQASRVLADVTTEVGVAVAPTVQQVVLRSVHFVEVSARRVLVVVVTQGGLVESRLLSVERDYGQSELDRISNYCSENFAGLALGEIRARLLQLMMEESAQWDDLLSGVVELARRAVQPDEEASGEVFIRGAERLLATAEPARLDAVRRLLAAFGDKATLLRLLNQFFSGPVPRVVLGSRFSLVEGGDLGLVASSFEMSTGEVGVVGVIGSRRMDYPHIIPVVDFVSRHLTESGHGGEGGK